jgi:hypothetical protein
MLADSRNAELYAALVAHIQPDEVKDAFRLLVGLAAEDPRHQCYPMAKGEVLDFRFETEDGAQPFSFITNQASLLFYVRKPGIRSGSVAKVELQAAFDSFAENANGEWTVRLLTPVDVKRLWQVIGPARDNFQSGSTDTTQIGYVNGNQQRCAGHRGRAGTDHMQLAYRMECQMPGCGYVYGANGTDVFQRRCPKCQGGRPGIAF